MEAERAICLARARGYMRPVFLEGAVPPVGSDDVSRTSIPSVLAASTSQCLYYAAA